MFSIIGGTALCCSFFWSTSKILSKLLNSHPKLARATRVAIEIYEKQSETYSDKRCFVFYHRIWGKLARVLNMLQSDETGNQLPSFKPLPEDTSLRGFQPLNDAHR